MKTKWKQKKKTKNKTLARTCSNNELVFCLTLAFGFIILFLPNTQTPQSVQVK